MKIKAVCDMFGNNTVWNLLNIHGWFATILGWGYFLVGNLYYLISGASVEIILKHNRDSAWFAAWTCSFLLAVHIYKKTRG
jgi:hypothetical protein